MKCLWFVLALVFLGSTPAFAAISYVPASQTICSQAAASAGSACTLTAATTAGNLVVAGLTWNTASTSINSVVGSAPGSYFFPYAQVCSSGGSCSAILICRECSAVTTVIPTFSSSTSYNLSVEEYSGVAAIGVTQKATGTSTAPGVTIATGEANDWIVAATASPGSASLPTPASGNLRNAALTGTSSNDVAGAACDNTLAAAGTLSCTATITVSAWSAVGVELRASDPTTHIWPDCDAIQPCVIHEKNTVALGTGTDTLTGPFEITVPPTLPGNLMKLTISHPSTAAIASISDDHLNIWTAGASTTDAGNAETTEVRYVCGAATGTSVITVAFDNAIVDGDVAQFSYDEVSGVAASACGDGGSGSSGGQGVLNPGPFTTTANGDLVFTFGICSSDLSENGNQAGVAMPEDNAAKVAENDYDQFMSMVEVQSAAGVINPTIYANAQDVNNTALLYWNVVSQAFKAANGAGTQPTGIQVVTDQHFINWPILGWNPLPSNGNAVIFSTSNPSAGWSMTNLRDNYGATYTRTPYTDPTVDPQQYFTCLGSNVSARDRIFSFTPDVIQTHVEIYTVAGAKNAVGTGCVGTTINHVVGTQGPILNDNIVGDPLITPTINGSFDSAIFTTSYIGTGPPTGMCISGGVTPPVCTGQSAGVIFNSIYATGMTDQSSWSTGDPFAFFYTNSTAPRSMDYLMANGTSGTALYGAAIEVFGGGVNTPALITPTVTVTPSATTVTVEQPLAVTVTVNGGPGQSPTGSVTLTSGAYTSGATILVSGAAIIDIPAASLAIGPDTLTVSYTPDTASSTIYNPATGISAPVTVTQAAPTVSILPTAGAITYGQTLASSTLTGGTASVPGTFAWTTPSITPGAGISLQSVTFTPTDTTDYSSVMSTVSITVNKATPTVSALPVASAISNGLSLASSALAGGTASVPGTFAWTAPGTIPPPGTSSQSVTFTPTDSTDYNTAIVTVSITVNNLTTPTVSVLPTASAITYGQTLGSSILTGGTASVPGAFAWTTPSTTPAAGTPAESVTFTPMNTTNYNSVSATVSVIVAQATPTVSVLPTASTINYGQTLASSTLTGGTASVPGAFTWTAPTTVPGAGTSAQSVTFTPKDTTDYTTVISMVNVTVVKGTPVVSAWPTASAITYGQTLASSILAGGTASVAGTFTWTTPGAVPNAGTVAESVTFTPTDATDYSTVVSTISVTVSKANPTVSAWPAASALVYGQRLGSAALTGGAASVPGTFSWTLALTVPPAGTDSESVTFTPADTTDYANVTQLVQVLVTPASLTVNAANAAVVYGQPIPQLTYTIAGFVNGDGTSAVSGAPVESTTATIGSPVGMYPITIAQGTLAAANYTFTFHNGILTVTLATATVTVTPAVNSITTAQALSVAISVSGGSGSPTPTGSVTLASGGYISTPATLTSGVATINIPAGSLAIGSDTLTASYSGDSSYGVVTGTARVTVTAAAVPSFVLSNSGAIVLNPGASTGNTSTITVTPSGGFTGNVALTASLSSSPSGANDPPTFSFGSTTPVSITGTTAGTAILTVTTTAATNAALRYPERYQARERAPWYAVGGATLASILFLGIPARRRKWRTILGMFVLLALLTGGLTSCGSNVGGGGGGSGNIGTSAGAYTVTVTGTSGSITESTTVTLTVN